MKLGRPNTKPGGPNVSQWNIVCVRSPGVGAPVGHVHFMLFVSILFALGCQRKRVFHRIWAIKNCWSASWAMCMMRLGQGDPVHLLYYHSPSRFKVHDLHTDV